MIARLAAAVVLIPGFVQIRAANQKLQPIYEAADFLQISRVLQNNKYKMVAKGKRIGRMFTLNVKTPAGSNMLYTQKNAVITDIDIWHKRIGHVNVQRLKTMQSQNVVAGLPNFQISGMQKVCEACQLGK